MTDHDNPEYQPTQHPGNPQGGPGNSSEEFQDPQGDAATLASQPRPAISLDLIIEVTPDSPLVQAPRPLHVRGRRAAIVELILNMALPGLDEAVTPERLEDLREPQGEADHRPGLPHGLWHNSLHGGSEPGSTNAPGCAWTEFTADVEGDLGLRLTDHSDEVEWEATVQVKITDAVVPVYMVQKEPEELCRQVGAIRRAGAVRVSGWLVFTPKPFVDAVTWSPAEAR